MPHSAALRTAHHSLIQSAATRGIRKRKVHFDDGWTAPREVNEVALFVAAVAALRADEEPLMQAGVDVQALKDALPDVVYRAPQHRALTVCIPDAADVTPEWECPTAKRVYLHMPPALDRAQRLCYLKRLDQDAFAANETDAPPTPPVIVM